MKKYVYFGITSLVIALLSMLGFVFWLVVVSPSNASGLEPQDNLTVSLFFLGMSMLFLAITLVIINKLNKS